MKTVICAGFDNFVFSAADWINPEELKLIAYACTMEDAYNIYDETGNVKDAIDTMPIMPIPAALAMEPDIVLLCTADCDEEMKLKMMLVQADYRGDVFSLREFFSRFSVKTAVIRKLSWRLEELGVAGAVGELGADLGDISWQMNALMPDRKMILFDTFQGTRKETLLSRMPYRNQVSVETGSFPASAMFYEKERYAFVHICERSFAAVRAGILYFYPRLTAGGVILLSGYEDGKTLAVREAVAAIEREHGAFLLLPVGDLDGSALIVRP